MLNRRKSIVGLDIGTSEVKAIELTDFGNSIKITGFGCGRLDPSLPVADVVSDVLRRSGIRCRRVCSSVSGRSVIVRYINLPMMSEDEIRGALRYEADKYIPFEIDEVVIDGQILEHVEAPSGEQECRVLLVAVKKDLIQEHVGLIQEIGLTPVIVDADTFALANAYELHVRNSPRVDDDENVVALLDIGAVKTNINILRGTTSYFSREVYLGGNDFTEAVARQLHIESEAAEELKRNPQDQDAEVSDALLPHLDDLANEIHLSFDYFENQFDREVTEVFVAGGSANAQGLEDVLQRIFDIPIHSWDPTENIELKGDRIDVEELKAHAAQLPIAIGLGARLLN